MPSLVSGYVYDTGVLIAAERGERLMWAVHRRILDQGIRPTVPSTVLGQAWRGGPIPTPGWPCLLVVNAGSIEPWAMVRCIRWRSSVIVGCGID